MDFGLTGVLLVYIRYVQRFLTTKSRMPDWDIRLNYSFFGLIALQLFSILADNTPGMEKVIDQYADLVSYLMFGLLTYLTYLGSRQYAPARPLLLALAPFSVVTILGKLTKLLAPTFFKEYSALIGSALVFSFFWLFALTIYANRQKKALEKERLEREAELERSRREKNVLEDLVAERTVELTRQKEELQQALHELRATQDQLVQREKLASLGELTAGIAHEIQNPLNFVNNFSEVSVELVQELIDERQKPDRDADLEGELLADLAQNLQKISQHGGRAANIVRNMLQHSRASTGQREPTDLNALADEYLRLSYHGLRAKDKSFNAAFRAELDPAVGKVNAVAQDIGRVLLNLCNNAFYAVQQRQRQEGAGSGYQPTVTIRTQALDKAVDIRVADNGTGIGEELKSKIFQPFFTTKPSGSGTGLGLSLSYDIITKGHGGTLTVDSTEGQGTTFIITLPTA